MTNFDDTFFAAIAASSNTDDAECTSHDPIEQPIGYNSVLAESNGNITFADVTRDDAWKRAIDVVDYPVEIHPAFYRMDDKFHNGKSLTNTGRESQFQMVVVDKLRNGQYNPIACVSDTYGTVLTASAYEELRDQLDDKGIKYSVKSLYVSGNGGSQLLNIQFDDIMDMVGIPDRISLIIQFSSSVDGTKSHTVNLFAYNHDIDAVFDFSGSVQRLAARHTTTLQTRTIDFIPAIIKLIENWNKVLVPYLMLLNDCVFDRKLALTVLEELSESSEMGKNNTTKIVSIIGDDVVDINKTYTLLDLNNIVGKFINDEMSEQNERSQKAVRDLGKSLKQVSKKYIK